MKHFCLILKACIVSLVISQAQAADVVLEGSRGSRLQGDIFGQFDFPWAMVFVSDTKLLVTERPGKLWLYDLQSKRKQMVGGLPEIEVGGQGGLGDIILHPAFEANQWVYFSYVEGEFFRKSGAVVMRAKLDLNESALQLSEKKYIWKQYPKVRGHGHYGHRMAFDSKGYLYITSGERQKFDPAQSLNGNLGKMIRLHDDGSIPDDNPFVDQGGIMKEVWSLGHRNPLGLVITPDDQIWEHEMGPKGGDELNRIEKGRNYGYPLVSQGDHYNGTPIPRHETRPEFEMPQVFWNPSISPAGFTYYDADRFPDWKGTAFMGGLSSRSISQIEFDQGKARVREQFFHDHRVRETEAGPQGYLWILEDRDGGRLLRLQPEN